MTPYETALNHTITTARAALQRAEQALAAFKASPENNVFRSLEHAQDELTEKLLDLAAEACEGSHVHGLYEYTQEFIVDDKRYIATVKVEYNRHDKRYYFVDGHSYSAAEAPQACICPTGDHVALRRPCPAHPAP
jgi:uncharacterized protein YchJ